VNEPDNHTAVVDRFDGTWVRVDEHPGTYGNWWPITDGPGFEPQVRDGVGQARPWDWVLRDTENHHVYGVHDADKDPGEPGGRIGEVSPVVGKVPRTPGRWHSQRPACAPRGCS
jgi:hypothetical protein